MEPEKVTRKTGFGNIISVSLIARRNISNSKGQTADQIADELLKLTHVRLDRENIESIDNLDCLGPVTNLYLQCNSLRTIENLDVLPNLRFLMLAENKITKIENLKHLNSLMFLDLSDNRIEDFDADQLPTSLVILNLDGNPCIEANDYKSKITKSLDNLEQLDGCTITKQQRKDYGCIIHDSDSDSEEKEEDGIQTDDLSLDCAAGELNQHCNDILVRAKIRTMKDNADHEKRLDEIANIRTAIVDTARHERRI